MKRKKASRPKLPKISEEMKAWSAALGAEVMEWPRVTARILFGFTALYRRDKIFAVLPRTRAMETPNSMAFKFDPLTAQLRARLERDARFGTTTMQAARWFTFELSTDGDLHDALDWLGRSYEAAGRRKRG
jgi:hypothetical protein